jgi:hypothetical protein
MFQIFSNAWGAFFNFRHIYFLFFLRIISVWCSKHRHLICDFSVLSLGAARGSEAPLHRPDIYFEFFIEVSVLIENSAALCLDLIDLFGKHVARVVVFCPSLFSKIVLLGVSHMHEIQVVHLHTQTYSATLHSRLFCKELFLI